MGVEIERKFLVNDPGWRDAVTESGQALAQGYLAGGASTTVRVRLAGNQAWLTIKGKNDGIRRAEFEYPIPVEDAKALLALCSEPPIEKVRYCITVGRHTWEVDEFAGANSGLVLAEIELSDEAEVFEMPTWVGPEVSDDARYYNVNLARAPFSTWSPNSTRPPNSTWSPKTT